MSQGVVPLRRRLFLVGFMGAGKTTVGRLLAQRLGWRFVDLDEELERRQGRSIARIFADYGEPYFRQAEQELLEETLAVAEPAVVALGGGTFAQPANWARIRADGGVTVWLECPLPELRRRCRGLPNRPLFRDAASFRRLYEQRLPYYEKADFRVDADRSDPAAVVEEILACVVI